MINDQYSGQCSLWNEMAILIFQEVLQCSESNPARITKSLEVRDLAVNHKAHVAHLYPWYVQTQILSSQNNSDEMPHCFIPAQIT